MNKSLPLFALAMLVFGSTFAVARQSFSQPVQHYQQSDPRSEWVGKCLAQIKTIRPGSSQREFDRLFETTGGLSDGKTYSFRQCPYFKVSVELKAGKVVSISGPYLNQVYSD